MEKNKTPGQIIRAYRKQRSITLENMAEVLYCSKSELSLFENDKKTISRMKRILWSSIVPHWTPEMLECGKPVKNNNNQELRHE